jgi:uracil-DNA glycosylase
VFGEGPSGARILLAGEQPGDVEDREGRPFVGPAGRVLDDALAAVGLDRRRVFLTNVVKHFR